MAQQQKQQINETKMSGPLADEDTTVLSPLQKIMPALIGVAEGGEMNVLTQAIIQAMPKNRLEADMFVTQMTRLRATAERAQQEAMQTYWALVRV